MDARQLLVSSSPTQYQCPGEDYVISPAVHRARLAAFYPKCRECPHRGDSSQMAPQIREVFQETVKRVEPETLFTDDGVRGIYLNQLDRLRAGQMAGALASLLWEEAPLTVREDADDTRPRPRRAGPMVVVGHDERPSSPDLVTGVAVALRRMGCQVTDVGLVTRACFAFAVDHLQAAAGMFVTGAGYGPAWTGLDFVGAGGIPFSRDHQLTEIERRFREGTPRPMRHSAGQRTFHPERLYEAGLRKHFHALRPLRVCVGCPDRPVRDRISRLFSKLPCQLQNVPVPLRSGNGSGCDEDDVRRIGAAIREGQAHLGMLIAADGQSCALFDELGELILPWTVTAVLAELLLREAPGGMIVVETEAAGLLHPVITALGGRTSLASGTPAGMALGLRMTDGLLAGGNSGRYWFRESHPTCDAVLTLARILQALSCSDADFSAIATRASTAGQSAPRRVG